MVTAAPADHAEGLTPRFLEALGIPTERGFDLEPPWEPEPAGLPDPTEHLTDVGNGRRLARQYGYWLRYSYQRQQWLYFNRVHWEWDTIGFAERLAKATARRIDQEVADCQDDDRRKDLRSHAGKSESAAKLKAMLICAASEPYMPVRLEELDADPWMLNCLNGCLDLRTGELRRHRADDLITKLAPVHYDPDARLDLLDTFLRDATGGDDELQAFLQRAAGYSLTGDTSEEKLFFVHGPGAAGKSTFVEALRSAIGTYARMADFETFLARSMVGGPRNDVAQLAGARFVASIEVDEGKRLAEGLMKQITGGDTVAARFLYHESFEFRPAFKLWLCANHAPKVRDDDSAMWRRILRIPFEHVVPKDDRDPRVKAMLRDPLIGGPAVLAWAVRGAMQWQDRGLDPPAAVLEATEAYRLSQDPLADFLAECCELEPHNWVASSLLRETYEAWAKENGREKRDVVGGKEWPERLRAAGCEPQLRRVWFEQEGKEKPTRGWAGITTSRRGEDPNGSL